MQGWADAWWEVGIAFGTVGARKGEHVIEITTYRAEVYRDDSRKPEVTYGDTLEGDLRRRDFTVNAMAVRLPAATFVDPYGGLRRPRRRSAADAGRAGGLVRRRPAADAAGRPVRRPARASRSTRRSSRR